MSTDGENFLYSFKNRIFSSTYLVVLIHSYEGGRYQGLVQYAKFLPFIEIHNPTNMLRTKLPMRKVNVMMEILSFVAILSYSDKNGV